MKTVLALACGFALAMSAQQASAQHAHETQAHEHTAAAAAAVPVPAQRWEPDAPLREGIRRAHTAVAQLQQYESGQMSASMAVEQAGEVESAVTYMFANCKLTAEPDAALHGILVPLLGAAQSLKADPKNVKAVDEMHAALAQYPQYFEDPGWDQSAPVEPAAQHQH